MLGHFDENDVNSFYYTDVSSEEAKEILEGEEEGVFLVRNSRRPGCYVVCLKEGTEVSQYLVEVSDGHLYVRKEHPFKDLPSLISFYKRNLFTTSALIRPVSADKVHPHTPKRQTMVDSVTIRSMEGKQPRPPHTISAPANMEVPVYARVTKARTPIGYDTKSLALNVGDVLRITRRRNGQGTGEVVQTGQRGDFPLTHVELIDNFEQ